jgi:hypothetical protein
MSTSTVYLRFTEFLPRNANSDEAARAFRDDVAQDTDMMSRGGGGSLANNLWHSFIGRSTFDLRCVSKPRASALSMANAKESRKKSTPPVRIVRKKVHGRATDQSQGPRRQVLNRSPARYELS